MLHSIFTQRVDSRIFVVRSQTASLTLGPSFDHNLCCRCPNGSYEAILNIYTSRPFQRYKKHLKARCFDFYNRALKLWESQRTPSSHFWECESHPHTRLKVGLRHLWLPTHLSNLTLCITNNGYWNLSVFNLFFHGTSCTRFCVLCVIGLNHTTQVTCSQLLKGLKCES